MSGTRAKGPIVVAKGTAGVAGLDGDGHPALDALYRRYWTQLCRYLNRRFGAGPPDPEDVAQAAFEKLARLDGLERVRNPGAFLYTTAINIALNDVRRMARVERFVRAELAEAGGRIVDEMSPERVYADRQRFHTLKDAIARLPDKQRHILIRSRFHGETYATISKATGWSQADISRQLNAALQTLQDALDRARRTS